MKAHFFRWLEVVLCSNALAIPAWFNSATPWQSRLAGFIGLNFVLVPIAMWLGVWRNRKTQRNQAEWSALNRTLDSTATDDVATQDDNADSAYARDSDQQIRKRIRHPSRANRNKESGTRFDSSGGGGDV